MDDIVPPVRAAETLGRRECLEIDVASSKISILEKNGYSPIGYFVLPEQLLVRQLLSPHAEGISEIP